MEKEDEIHHNYQHIFGERSEQLNFCLCFAHMDIYTLIFYVIVKCYSSRLHVSAEGVLKL